MSKGRTGLEHRAVIQNKLCRSYDEFIEELRKESDFEVNVPANYGRPATAMLHAAALGCRNKYNKNSLEPAHWCRNGYKREAKPLNSAGYADGDEIDLPLTGLFCFCLLVINLACWSFFAGVPAVR